MAHTVTYNSRDNIVEVKVQGDLTLSIIKEIASEGWKVAKEQNCHSILSDLREAEIKLSTLEIYELPKVLLELAASSGLDLYKVRRAFVAQKGLNDLKFYETVTFNRSQNARYFLDMDEARKWLSEK